MSVIIVLMTASFSIAVVFLIAFIWAVKTDQFEDTMTPALRILHEDKSNINNKQE
jgi:cbb3-type cytochrome oxidase maturation protein